MMFGLHTIPFGIITLKNSDKKRMATVVNDRVVDLNIAQENGIFDGLHLPENIFLNDYLNPFISLGKSMTNGVRNYLLEAIKVNVGTFGFQTFSLEEVENHLPIKIGNYTDFYACENHAANVGRMFRDKENPLHPNWKNMPIAYHGRASSIVGSGNKVIRPIGQVTYDGITAAFVPSEKLDFELELGIVIGKESPLGKPIPIDEAEDYIFGVVLLNDWSARDIQRWEYQPLGPFLSKNFCTSISHWVITSEALKPFSNHEAKFDVPILPYLSTSPLFHFNIDLEIFLDTGDGEQQLIATTNTKELYWTVTQMITHHTITGCNLCIGDLLGTGTISGKNDSSLGSLLEMTLNGQKPIILKDNQIRTFLEDGDKIIFKGRAKNSDGYEINIGELVNTIAPNNYA
jgi:fumarylacetoacetase